MKTEFFNIKTILRERIKIYSSNNRLNAIHKAIFRGNSFKNKIVNENF